jgi:hypothetical protein
MKRAWVGILMVLMASSVILAGEWGVGISSEPMDIAGGGFFVDSFIDLPVIGLRNVTNLSLRPSFGLGPLPINPRVLFLDLQIVWSLALGEMSAYVGAGPSLMVSTDFSWTSLDGLAVAGIDSIRITDSITNYIEVKVRGTGFFISPGVGFVFGF